MSNFKYIETFIDNAVATDLRKSKTHSVSETAKIGQSCVTNVASLHWALQESFPVIIVLRIGTSIVSIPQCTAGPRITESGCVHYMLGTLPYGIILVLRCAG